MANQSFCLFALLLFFFFFFITNEVSAAGGKQPSQILVPINRTSFPPNFIFGAASSSYQYEGAVKEGGRGPSIWDTFTHKYPEKITDRSNGDVADDFYHRYKEDIKLMKRIGLNGFRLSISWSRVLPYGKLSKGVNRQGIAFYNNVINELLANGLTPSVTLFHWDLPQALEDEYGGFLSPKIVDDFKDFAELCFKEFGDRVKQWATFNEPWTFCAAGYDSGTFVGTHAPGRCSAWINKGCPAGDSSTEPYLVAHHILISHATAAKLYRQKYKPFQKGQIGIVLVTNWIIPYSNSKADAIAAERALDFFYGWFLNPLTYGEYPKVIQIAAGNRLPKFTAEESKLVKGSYDFLGVNYYTSNYAAPLPVANPPNISYSTDFQVNLTSKRNGRFIGEPTGASIFFSYPDGLKQLLIYTKKKYNDPIIYITENGYADSNLNTVKEGTNDPQRIRFYHGHFLALKGAIDAGVKVKGFFAWTFLDTFEWPAGYTLRFGLVFVDFKNGLKRYPKRSALWWKKLLA